MRPLSASVPGPKNEAFLKSKRIEIREPFVKGSSRGEAVIFSIQPLFEDEVYVGPSHHRGLHAILRRRLNVLSHKFVGTSKTDKLGAMMATLVNQTRGVPFFRTHVSLLPPP